MMQLISNWSFKMLYVAIAGLVLMLGSACSSSANPLDDSTTPEPYPAPQDDAGAPYPPPWQPVDEDASLEVGSVTITDSQIIPHPAGPEAFALRIQGSLPNPCQTLRATIAPVDDQGRILVEVYSVYDPAEICVQVLEVFDEALPLAEYVPGETTVWLNGSQVE
jgi:hypothetical protein